MNSQGESENTGSEEQWRGNTWTRQKKSEMKLKLSFMFWTNKWHSCLCAREHLLLQEVFQSFCIPSLLLSSTHCSVSLSIETRSSSLQSDFRAVKVSAMAAPRSSSMCVWWPLTQSCWERLWLGFSFILLARWSCSRSLLVINIIPYTLRDYSLETRHQAKTMSLQAELISPPCHSCSRALHGSLTMGETHKKNASVGIEISAEDKLVFFVWRERSTKDAWRHFTGQLEFQSELQAWHQCLCVETGKSYPTATVIKATQ